MTEDPFWKNIAPEYIWLAADFHGMTAVYTHKPIYMEKPAKWGLPNSTGKRLDLSLLQEPPRDKAPGTLMVRPGHDSFTGVPFPPPAPKETANIVQIIGQPAPPKSVMTTTNLPSDTYTIAQTTNGIALDQLSILKDMADLIEPIIGSLLAMSAAIHAGQLASGPSQLMRQIVALSDRLDRIKNSIEVLRKVQNGKAP